MGCEVQKDHFLGPKGLLLGGTAPPQNQSWLRAWRQIEGGGVGLQLIRGESEALILVYPWIMY